MRVKIIKVNSDYDSYFKQFIGGEYDAIKNDENGYYVLPIPTKFGFPLETIWQPEEIKIINPQNKNWLHFILQFLKLRRIK